jgi:tRNA G46 methylase TrmB
MKTQRNSLCHCNSGKKYKDCCLTKDQEKSATDKKFGATFTPPELVVQMLDKLPKSQFEDPTKTFLDPSCGNGNFLVEILKRKIANKHPILLALLTTYGIEIQENHAEECRQRLYDIAINDGRVYNEESKELFKSIINHNIVCADTLKFDISTWGGKGQHWLWNINKLTK